MARVYFHIDLNAFFANAEVLRDPGLKGLPVAVSGNTRRSVVSTASYEARRFGIHSAMPLSEALHLCPELVVVEPHFPLYRELSEQFIRIISENADEIEQASIDECYADMTREIRKYEKPLDLAWFLQKKIYHDLGLPCSIGVAPNMFLAKMASDMKKPLGITVLRLREVEEKLWPLDISDMRGVGVKTVPLLRDLGINTIGDLACYEDISRLKPIFGKNTDVVLQRAHGHDDRQIVRDWDTKSMGVSETVLDDLTDYDEIRGLLRSLARKLSKRLWEEQKAGHSISLRIKYNDFQNTDRSRKLAAPIWKSDDLYVQALQLLDDNWNGEPVRLLGISLSDFAEGAQLTSQLNLFDETEALKEETSSVLNELNAVLGGKVLKRASEAGKEN